MFLNINSYKYIPTEDPEQYFLFHLVIVVTRTLPIDSLAYSYRQEAWALLNPD